MKKGKGEEGEQETLNITAELRMKRGREVVT